MLSGLLNMIAYVIDILMWLVRFVEGVPYYDQAVQVSASGEGYHEMEMEGMDSRNTRIGFLKGTRFYAHESEMVAKPDRDIQLVDRFIDQELDMIPYEIPAKMTQLAQITFRGKSYAHVYRDRESGLPAMRRDNKITLWYPDTTWADLLPALEEEDCLFVDFQEDVKRNLLSTEVLAYDLLDIQVC